MRRKILVVDDSPTVRAQTLGILGKEFETLSASDGAEGLQLMIEEQPDAVVADLEMPKMTGIDLLRAVKEDDRVKQIPIVIATNVTALEQVNECRSLGCAGFVLKPVQGEYLVAKLRQLLLARGS